MLVSLAAIRTRGAAAGPAALRHAGASSSLSSRQARGARRSCRRFAHLHAHLLLIADQTTSEAREILAEHGVAVVDGLGNAHMELPGLLFHLEGRGRPGRRTKRRHRRD